MGWDAGSAALGQPGSDAYSHAGPAWMYWQETTKPEQRSRYAMAVAVLARIVEIMEFLFEKEHDLLPLLDWKHPAL